MTHLEVAITYSVRVASALPKRGYCLGKRDPTANVNMEFNVARQWRKIAPDLQDNIRSLNIVRI